MDPKPISNIFGVGKCSGKSNESHIVSSLLSNVPHSADYDFDDWTSLLTKEMDLINDYKCYLLHIASVLPVSTDTVPLLWCSDQHISFLESLDVRCDITCELKHYLGQRSILQSLFPVDYSLLCQCLQWSYVDNFGLRAVLEDPEHCKL